MPASSQLEFNLDAALADRDEGIARVASNSASWVEIARAEARSIARERGEVTADDVRRVLYPQGLRPRHYNAWGAVFQVGFVFTGRYHTSEVRRGHGNQQRVWRLADGADRAA